MNTLPDKHREGRFKMEDHSKTEFGVELEGWMCAETAAKAWLTSYVLPRFPKLKLESILPYTVSVTLSSRLICWLESSMNCESRVYLCSLWISEFSPWTRVNHRWEGWLDVPSSLQGDLEW